MTVEVDLEALVEAFEDASEKLDYYVDRQTGEIVLVSETLGFIEASLQREAMAEEPDRFVKLPVSGALDFEADIEAFIDSNQGQPVADDLEEALEDDNPIRTINRILAERPEIVPALDEFRRERTRKRAQAWLNESVRTEDRDRV